MNGVTSDGFIDFRSWLIAQGKEVYLNTLANPDSLSDTKMIQSYITQQYSYQYAIQDENFSELPKFELFGYAALDAYEKSNTANVDFYEDYRTFSLSLSEKNDIASEIQYSKNINMRPDGRLSSEATSKKLEEMFPQLKELIGNAEQRGYDFESILLNIIETGKNSTKDGRYFIDLEGILGEFFSVNTMQIYQNEIFDILENHEAVLDTVSTDDDLFYIDFHPDHCPNYEQKRNEIKDKPKQKLLENKPSIRDQLQKSKKDLSQKQQKTGDRSKGKNEKEI